MKDQRREIKYTWWKWDEYSQDPGIAWKAHLQKEINARKARQGESLEAGIERRMMEEKGML